MRCETAATSIPCDFSILKFIFSIKTYINARNLSKATGFVGKHSRHRLDIVQLPFL